MRLVCTTGMAVLAMLALLAAPGAASAAASPTVLAARTAASAAPAAPAAKPLVHYSGARTAHAAVRVCEFRSMFGRARSCGRWHRIF
jgi:hypothetical protein